MAARSVGSSVASERTSCARGWFFASATRAAALFSNLWASVVAMIDLVLGITAREGWGQRPGYQVSGLVAASRPTLRMASSPSSVVIMGVMVHLLDRTARLQVHPPSRRRDVVREFDESRRFGPLDRQQADDHAAPEAFDRRPHQLRDIPGVGDQHPRLGPCTWPCRNKSASLHPPPDESNWPWSHWRPDPGSGPPEWPVNVGWERPE